MSLVSIIMPAYNSGNFISESIESVLNQSYGNWELLIVNDGSTDNTEEIVLNQCDLRIQYFKKDNGGVSSARNVGLKNMNGDFFCFLDADDTFPSNSIKSRMACLGRDNDISFVDGSVNFMDSDMTNVIKQRKSDYKGETLTGLCTLNPLCFFGNTWLVRRDFSRDYKFRDGLTHGEDLLFYFEYCSSGILGNVPDGVLNYRTGHTSAMSNLKGLENGYRFILNVITNEINVPNKLVGIFRKKTRSIMFKSYLGSFQVFNSLRVFFIW